MNTTRGNRRIIEARTVHSTHLGEERPFKVCLPPDYDESSTYPALYCHDGNEFITHGRIVTIAHEMMAQGDLKPFVIVALPVKKPARVDEYSPTGARSEAHVRFVIEECLPFVEDHYAVSRRDEDRYMAGVSLGAAAALHTYLLAPESFRKLLMFSGAFYSHQQAQVKQRATLKDLSAFMVVGYEETAVDTPVGAVDFYRASQQMRDALRLRGADIEYREAQGNHLWGFWQGQLPSALNWLHTH